MRGLLLALILSISVSAGLAQDRPMRFGITRHTIAEFSLAPPGSVVGPGPMQERQGRTVDPDERLRSPA